MGLEQLDVPLSDLIDQLDAQKNQFGAANLDVPLSSVRDVLTSLLTGGVAPSGAAGGDLSGTFPNPAVAKLGGAALPSNVANGVLGRNSANTGWEEKVAGGASGLATLDSGGKVPTSQLPAAILGALNYQGTWNATTNSPALVSSTGSKGFYYKVSVAGTTSIDGNAEWNVGDFIAFNGTVWDKIDSTEEDATASVKGRIQLTGDLGGTAASPTVVAATTLVAGKVQLAGDLGGTSTAPTLAGTAQALSPTFAVLVDGSTVTWALASVLNSNATVTIAGARTLAFTGLVAGASGVLKVVQGSGGSHTLVLPAGSLVANAGAGAVTLSTAVSAIDILSFYYDGTNIFWTISLNFS